MAKRKFHYLNGKMVEFFPRTKGPKSDNTLPLIGEVNRVLIPESRKTKGKTTISETTYIITGVKRKHYVPWRNITGEI